MISQRKEGRGIHRLFLSNSMFFHLMTHPRHLNVEAIHCIIGYLKGTSDHSLFFPTGTTLKIYLYSDTDWDGCTDYRLSTIYNKMMFWFDANLRNRTAFPSLSEKLSTTPCHLLVSKLFGFAAFFLHLVFLNLILHRFMRIIPVLIHPMYRLVIFSPRN